LVETLKIVGTCDTSASVKARSDGGGADGDALKGATAATTTGAASAGAAGGAAASGAPAARELAAEEEEAAPAADIRGLVWNAAARAETGDAVSGERTRENGSAAADDDDDETTDADGGEARGTRGTIWRRSVLMRRILCVELVLEKVG